MIELFNQVVVVHQVRRIDLFNSSLQSAVLPDHLFINIFFRCLWIVRTEVTLLKAIFHLIHLWACLSCHWSTSTQLNAFLQISIRVIAVWFGYFVASLLFMHRSSLFLISFHLILTLCVEKLSTSFPVADHRGLFLFLMNLIFDLIQYSPIEVDPSLISLGFSIIWS